jgi:orotidine-5'-phosphate decarboxylase
VAISSGKQALHDEARMHLALALDVAELERALVLARRTREHFGVVKVGLELFSAYGPAAVSALGEEGFVVFCDLKLHDIPTTVARAAERIGALRPRYLSVHGGGGREMVRAAVEGFAVGSRGAPGGILAVTVLTSDRSAARRDLEHRSALAAETGCAGVVCAASDLALVRPLTEGLVRAVPGVRPQGAARDDQARVATPAEAVAAGASLVVVGRAVTAAADPGVAARDVHAEVASALFQLGNQF